MKSSSFSFFVVSFGSPSWIFEKFIYICLSARSRLVALFLHLPNYYPISLHAMNLPSTSTTLQHQQQQQSREICEHDKINFFIPVSVFSSVILLSQLNKLSYDIKASSVHSFETKNETQLEIEMMCE